MFAPNNTDADRYESVHDGTRAAANIGSRVRPTGQDSLVRDEDPKAIRTVISAELRLSAIGRPGATSHPRSWVTTAYAVGPQEGFRRGFSKVLTPLRFS